jgi:hypothetical protein
LAKSLVDTTVLPQPDTIGGNSGFTVVAYLGLADAGTAEGAPYNAIQLQYNGQAFSIPAVEDGTYALWGYEYIGYAPSSSSAVTGLWSALGNLTTGLGGHVSTSTLTIAGVPTVVQNEIPMGSMVVGRTSYSPLNPPQE